MERTQSKNKNKNTKKDTYIKKNTACKKTLQGGGGACKM